MKHQKPTVSVVVPVLNECPRIGKLVAAIQSQTYQPPEIIVVDSKSKDGTAAAAKEAGARVLQTERGVAHQRNAGAEAASGEWIFFMDADVTLKPDFIENALHEVQRRELDFACPRYWPNGSSLCIKAIHITYNVSFWMMQKLIPSGGGSCIIVRKTVFKRAGGFDVRYPFEDMKFLRTCRRYGRFGFLSVTIGVSDRRFKRDGLIRTTLLYALLTPLFLLNLYRLTRYVRYNFGHYEK